MLDEEPDFVVSAAKYLLDLWFFFNISTVQELISLFRRKRFDLISIRDHVCCVADCDKFANRTLQQNLMNTQFQPVKVGVEKKFLMMKSTVAVSQTQQRAAEIDGEKYF